MATLAVIKKRSRLVCPSCPAHQTSNLDSISNLKPNLVVADRMLAAGRTLHKDPLWAFFVRHDEQETRLQVRAWTALLLADKVLPKAIIDDIHEYFAPCEVSNMFC